MGVARARAKAKAPNGARVKGRPGRKPKPGGSRSVLLSCKCHPTYKGWVERFASDRESSEAGLIEQGLSLLARELGYEAPPPR